MIIVINVKNLWIGKIVNSKLDIKILIILQYCRSLIPLYVHVGMGIMIMIVVW